MTEQVRTLQVQL